MELKFSIRFFQQFRYFCVRIHSFDYPSFSPILSPTNEPTTKNPFRAFGTQNLDSSLPILRILLCSEWILQIIHLSLHPFFNKPTNSWKSFLTHCKTNEIQTLHSSLPILSIFMTPNTFLHFDILCLHCLKDENQHSKILSHPLWEHNGTQNSPFSSSNSLDTSVCWMHSSDYSSFFPSFLQQTKQYREKSFPKCWKIQ